MYMQIWAYIDLIPRIKTYMYTWSSYPSLTSHISRINLSLINRKIIKGIEDYKSWTLDPPKIKARSYKNSHEENEQFFSSDPSRQKLTPSQECDEL